MTPTPDFSSLVEALWQADFSNVEQGIALKKALLGLVDEELAAIKANNQDFRLAVVRAELMKALGGDICALTRDFVRDQKGLTPRIMVRRAIEAASMPIPVFYKFTATGVFVTRPDDRLLQELLVINRESNNGIVQENRLRQGIYAAIDYQAQGLAKKYSLLEDQLDDLVTKAKQRVENKLLTSGVLLPDFDLSGGASIYSFLWKATENIARNIIDEDRVPSHGMQSKRLVEAIDAFQRLGEPSQDGGVALRRLDMAKKIRRHVSMGEFSEADENGGRFLATLPDGLMTIDETPIAVRCENSAIRVRDALLPLLRKLASDMPGKIIVCDKKQIRLTVSHKLVWEKYLALEAANNHDLFGISTEELGNVVGLSDATIKRRIADCYAFLIQHKDYKKIVATMVPYRLTRHANESREVEMVDVLAEGIKAALIGKHDSGKKQFRELVQEWIREYGMHS